jgi:hypothetical protein
MLIAGRQVKIATGAKSQTVNVCTAANRFGEYDYKVRLHASFVTPEELEQRRFASLDQLVDYLVERGGKVEHRPDGVVETRPRSPFELWAARWIELATYAGPVLQDADRRIRLALDLWHEPIPEPWERGFDHQLAGLRYRRGDVLAPHAGEHTLEAEVLADPLEGVRCFGGTLVDGVNAVPLSLDPSGGRRANVEADLLLLVRDRDQYWVGVGEVKHSSNHAWYAAIENLRQLRLVLASAEAGIILHQRNPDLALLERLPVRGLVIAPLEFFRARGQKGNSVAATQRLLETFRSETNAQPHLAVWDPAARTIEAFD